MAKRRGSRETRQQQSKNLNRLRKLGLYEPKAKAAVTPKTVTSHGKKIISRYRDVLAGRATVVRARGGKEKTAAQRAKEYKGSFRVRGDRIVINHPPTAKPRFSAKTGEITIDVKNVGEIRRGILKPIEIRSVDDLRKVERGGFYFGMPFRRFGSNEVDWLQYDDVEELINDMAAYPSYKNWARYVVLIPRTTSKVQAERTLNDSLDEDL